MSARLVAHVSITLDEPLVMERSYTAKPFTVTAISATVPLSPGDYKYVNVGVSAHSVKKDGTPSQVRVSPYVTIEDLPPDIVQRIADEANAATRQRVVLP